MPNVLNTRSGSGEPVPASPLQRGRRCRHLEPRPAEGLMAVILEAQLLFRALQRGEELVSPYAASERSGLKTELPPFQVRNSLTPVAPADLLAAPTCFFTAPAWCVPVYCSDKTGGKGIGRQGDGLGAALGEYGPPTHAGDCPSRVSTTGPREPRLLPLASLDC